MSWTGEMLKEQQRVLKKQGDRITVLEALLIDVLGIYIKNIHSEKKCCFCMALQVKSPDEIPFGSKTLKTDYIVNHLSFCPIGRIQKQILELNEVVANHCDLAFKKVEKLEGFLKKIKNNVKFKRQKGRVFPSCEYCDNIEDYGHTQECLITLIENLEKELVEE